MYTIIEKSYLESIIADDNYYDYPEDRETIITDISEEIFVQNEDLVIILGLFGAERITPEKYKQIFTELSENHPIMINRMESLLRGDSTFIRRERSCSDYSDVRVYFEKEYILKIE